MPDLNALLLAQKAHFFSGATLPPSARLDALRALADGVHRREKDLLAALHADLGKSPTEAYLTEVGIVLSEIRHFQKHLAAWLKPRRPLTPFTLWPGQSRVHLEPLGQTLILSPWNYPVQLNLVPLVTALAAGNTAVLKPSGSAPASARVLEELMAEALPPELALVLNGGHDLADALLAYPFDFIFYTGSARVGRKVMAAAAAHLTPVCLELGGKSPVLVAEDAQVDLAAKRIAWGKVLNAGQTCISPDYVLVHPARKAELVARLRHWFEVFAPGAPLNENYPRLVNEAAFARLTALAPHAAADAPSLRIAPLVMDDIGPEHPVMEEEIFGPLLPVIALDTLDTLDAPDALPPAATPLDAAIAFIKARPKPLAFYLFTQSRETEAKVMGSLSFGGGCVNDVLMHVSSPGLPFGGVGESGTGRYHGRAGLELMSNVKSVLRRGAFDLPMRFPPWTDKALALFRRVMG